MAWSKTRLIMWNRLALQVQPVVVGKIVDAATQNVILRNDLFNVKGVLESLETMSVRTAFAERFWDRLVRLGLECRCQFVKQAGNVIVERGNVKLSALKGVAAPVAANARVMRGVPA